MFVFKIEFILVRTRLWLNIGFSLAEKIEIVVFCFLVFCPKFMWKTKGKQWNPVEKEENTNLHLCYVVL